MFVLDYVSPSPAEPFWVTSPEKKISILFSLFSTVSVSADCSGGRVNELRVNGRLCLFSVYWRPYQNKTFAAARAVNVTRIHTESPFPHLHFLASKDQSLNDCLSSLAWRIGGKSMSSLECDRSKGRRRLESSQIASTADGDCHLGDKFTRENDCSVHFCDLRLHVLEKHLAVGECETHYFCW